MALHAEPGERNRKEWLIVRWGPQVKAAKRGSSALRDKQSHPGIGWKQPEGNTEPQYSKLGWSELPSWPQPGLREAGRCVIFIMPIFYQAPTYMYQEERVFFNFVWSFFLQQSSQALLCSVCIHEITATLRHDLRLKRLRHREVKSLLEGHTAIQRKWIVVNKTQWVLLRSYLP